MLAINKKIFSLLIVALFLNGCVHGQPQANVKVNSVNYLNPNILNQASPVVVSIYQLKDSLAFQQANLYTFFNDPSKALGEDLIDKQEVEIHPGQKLKFKIPLSDHTHYIGVVGAFRQADEAKWRKIIKVKAGKNVTLKIHLSTQGIQVTK